MSFNVVCLKWGDKYPAEYVNNLYNMVQRNTTIPHRFVCFTDDTTGIVDEIETKELLAEGLEGWWNKVSLFREEVSDLRGKIVFLDLDIVICNNIDYLFTDEPDESFVSVEDFLFPERSYNSSVFRLKIGAHQEVWDNMKKLKQQENGSYDGFGRNFHGDQDYITYIIYPNGEHIKHCFKDKGIYSFKKELKSGNPLPDTSIVVFHGNPNPHEVPHPWVRKHWS